MPLVLENFLDNNQVTNPLIVGGFIGLEVLENLFERGFKPIIVEATNQILPRYDIEIAKLLEKKICRIC